MQQKNYSLLAAILTIIILSLAACASSSGGSTEPAPASIATETPAQIETVPEPEPTPTLADTNESESTSFILARENEFSEANDNGYSVYMMVKTWYGIIGTGEEIQHPVDPSISIPPVDSQSMVIPFYVEVRNTTGDTSFKQDLHLGAYSGSRNFDSDIRNSYTQSLYINNSWEKMSDKVRVLYDSIGGDWMGFAGKYILPDTRTPASPNPDLSNVESRRKVTLFESNGVWYFDQIFHFYFTANVGGAWIGSSQNPFVLAQDDTGITAYLKSDLASTDYIRTG